MKTLKATLPVLIPLLCGWASTAAQETAPRVVHDQAPAPFDRLDPARLARRLPDPPAGPGKLIPNQFPAAASFAASGPPGSIWPAPAGPVTRVVEMGPENTLAALPAIDVRFDAPFDGGVAPPDPVLAAGRNHVIALVNSRVGIYSKSGTLLQGPFSMAEFFNIPAGFGIFDPLAIYDPFSDRFIAAVLADNGAAKDSRIFVAFSQTAEATGPWFRYWINADAGQPKNWADYGSIGIDRHAVYFTANLFTRGGGYSNVTLYIYDKEDGYAGRPLTNTHLVDVRTQGGASPYRLRPAFVGETVPGEAYYLAHTESYAGSQINLLTLTGDRFASPSLTATSLSTPGFFFQPGKARQPGSGQGVDTLGANLWNLFYRGGKLWTAQAISGNGAVAWVHRIAVGGGAPTLEQTFQVESPGKDIYFPHVIPDFEDHDFLLLSAYSSATIPVTGRYFNVSGAGTIRTGENLAAGTYRNDSGRHGDYFAVGIDPSDPNRYWMIAQYMGSSTFAGNARLASVRFEDLPPPQSLPPVPDGKIVAGSLLRVAPAAGGAVTVTWDPARCPAPGNHLVWFDLGGMASYTVAAVTCGAGQTGSWTGTPPGGSVGVVAVSDDNAATEGSHGYDSLGRERPSSVTACGITQKLPGGPCP